VAATRRSAGDEEAHLPGIVGRRGGGDLGNRGGGGGRFSRETAQARGATGDQGQARRDQYLLRHPLHVFPLATSVRFAATGRLVLPTGDEPQARGMGRAWTLSGCSTPDGHHPCTEVG